MKDCNVRERAREAWHRQVEERRRRREAAEAAVAESAAAEACRVLDVDPACVDAEGLQITRREPNGLLEGACRVRVDDVDLRAVVVRWADGSTKTELWTWARAGEPPERVRDLADLGRWLSRGG